MRFEKNSIEAVKVIRIALASLLAILAADVLGLKYSATAGIIALLSIQDTKRETVWGAVRRCISYIAAVGVSWVVFHFFGFHAYSYGVFLLIFVVLLVGALSFFPALALGPAAEFFQMG